ncbi:MAG TPA: hypothetical protein VL137_08900 [Polyangiaceae bacterium]|nr:hypothetical protein [Polyangiaceae bacterium]
MAKQPKKIERPGVAEVPDPLSGENLKSLALRLGLPLLGIWVLGLLIAGVSETTWVRYTAIGFPALLTVAAIGLIAWTVRQAGKMRGVASILGSVESAEDRKAAIEKLDSKGNDPMALFAKAQLVMQEDPRAALAVLEQIDLGKVMASVADEARGQRAMIHLMLGDVTPARDLADGIDLSRHQDTKTKAMLAAVTAEAWARTGLTQRAQNTLDIFNPEDEILAPVRPQLHRARAFICANTGDIKAMRRALRKLADQDARLLAGFMMKKTHPLLQKEAKKMLEQSGQMPRKMMVQRS